MCVAMLNQSAAAALEKYGLFMAIQFKEFWVVKNHQSWYSTGKCIIVLCMGDVSI